VVTIVNLQHDLRGAARGQPNAVPLSFRREHFRGLQTINQTGINVAAVTRPNKARGIFGDRPGIVALIGIQAISAGKHRVRARQNSAGRKRGHVPTIVEIKRCAVVVSERVQVRPQIHPVILNGAVISQVALHKIVDSGGTNQNRFDVHRDRCPPVEFAAQFISRIFEISDVLLNILFSVRVVQDASIKRSFKI
jgi:hypothetical protein